MFWSCECSSRWPTSERITASLSMHRGHPRQQLAELDAGDVGGDRLELAADLRRGVGFRSNVSWWASPPDR